MCVCGCDYTVAGMLFDLGSAARGERARERARARARSRARAREKARMVTEGEREGVTGQWRLFVWYYMGFMEMGLRIVWY